MFARFREKIKLRGGCIRDISQWRGKEFQESRVGRTMEETVPATRQGKSSNAISAIKRRKESAPPSISFLSIHPSPSLPGIRHLLAAVVAIMSPGVLFRLGRENIGATKKGKTRTREEGRRWDELVVVSMRRFVGIAGRYAGRISSMINGW